MSIQKKLVLTLLFTILGFAVILSFISYTTHVAEVDQRIDREQQKALYEISTLLDLTDGIMSERVVSSMKLLKERGMALGDARLGERVDVNGTSATNLYLGDQGLANQFDLVDSLTAIMGGTATIFARQGEDFIRISTNVMKEGKRAIGTKLAPQGKAMAAIRQGKAYYGEVDILGKPYLTAYEPLKNRTGEVIGIWYVGYSADLVQLSEALANMAILDQGFVSLRDGKDIVRLHTSGVPTELIDAAIKGSDNWQVRVVPYEAWGYDIVLGTNTGEASAMVRGSVLKALASLLGMLIVLGAVVYVMIQSVVMRPLLYRIATIRELADGEGDLTRRFNSSRNDEFGTMADEFDRLLARLQQTMKSVATESARVRDVTGRLGNMANSLNQTQIEQSDQTKSVASAAHELSVSAREVTSTTGEAKETTTMALDQVRQGAALLGRACERIQSQASSIQQSEQVVEQLASDSASISTVLDVIKNIAEQTNLLALNAAIEAARAGEQGRGFAVVADEVRSLASRTQASTQEINDMVDRLQKQGRHATELMQTNRSESSENAEMISEVSGTFQSVVGAMDSLSLANDSIARTTREQGMVTENMSQDIEAISRTSDQNAQLAQDTQKACEELSNAVRSMESMINQYKLG